MRGWIKVLLAIVLIALPVGLRWISLYPGSYAQPVIPEIDDSELAVPPPEYRPLAVEAVEGVGRVVIDVAHYNNLEVDDLTPLRDRLSARGVASETYEGFSGTLESQLRGATGLVIVAPTFEYLEGERDAVVDFVEKGGRVLLAADPTRPVPSEEEPRDLADILFHASAIPAINSVANPLGVSFFEDYLYNLVDNAGNFRNVRFTPLGDDHPLTQDLETVVFFAAHSLRSDGLSLLTGDENTLSYLRSGETDLTAAGLAAEGRVLALGDVTFLTAPSHTVADNDQFLSNIADWLAAAEPEWNLDDFPYLFQGPVDLVQVAGEYLDPRLIAQADTLREALDQANLTLNVRATADSDHDALYVGIFENVEQVEEYLDAAGVSITLVEEDEEARATPTPTPTAGEGDEEEEPRDSVEVTGLGNIALEGTTLFVVDRDDSRVVLVVLAEDGEAVMEAIDRLVLADFSGCVDSDGVTVCSTGEVEDGLGLDFLPRKAEEEVEEPLVEDEEIREEEEEPVELPTIGSLSESADAFFAGTPWLEELAEESYDTTSQPGDTYEYTIAMDRSQDLIWAYGWCTATPEQLVENWENISLVFTLDDTDVPLDSFVELESSLEDQECRLYYALVSDWPDGAHLLTTEVTFATELDDGFETYPAGTHVFEYSVTVGS